MPISKFTIFGDISTKSFKQQGQFYSEKLKNIFNTSIKMGKNPDILKNAGVTPVYKKDDMNAYVPTLPFWTDSSRFY